MKRAASSFFQNSTTVVALIVLLVVSLLAVLSLNNGKGSIVSFKKNVQSFDNFEPNDPSTGPYAPVGKIEGFCGGDMGTCSI